MKNRRINILGIESSADETAAAILTGDKRTKKIRLKSNLISSQIDLHRKTGGIVPEVAARAHLPAVLPLISHSLQKARLPLNKISAIAVTAGPGLITSLRIGVDTAKTLAFALNIPLIAVNHHEGHLLSGLSITNNRLSIKFPAVGLVVSGGHTMLVLAEKIGKYKILGQTLDDAAGECFDKAAKIMGLPYPGGPAISQCAAKWKSQITNIKFQISKVELPRPMINSRDYNFSFAGLKTAVLYKVREFGKLNNNLINQIAYKTEQAIVDVLVSKTIRAAKQYKAKTILLGGGVSANQKLRSTLAKEIKKQLPATHCQLPPPEMTTDNAGMIAIAGWYKLLAGKTKKYSQIKADPNLQLKSWR